jgi:dipeptidyl aminopeptidase/acylaminoacyl peptidase
MNRMWKVLMAVVLTGFCSVAGASHPFSVHDMLAMDRISDFHVSPDGSAIVFVVRQTDLDANKGRTDLWMVDTQGQNLRQLTTAPEADFNPRWSPDGQCIWFLSTRGGSSQVWQLPVGGGEARQITDLPLDVGNLVVSPDNCHLAFTLDVFPNSTLEETGERLKARTDRQATGHLYESVFVRHWDTWKDGRRSHLFVLNPGTNGLVDVMKAMDADTPSKPFGGPEEITFTPDGTGLVFSARDVGRQEPWSTDFDLYLAPIDGSSAPACLTDDNAAWDTSPVFSPDGKTLAYLAMSRPGYESDQYKIVLQDWLSGPKRILAKAWDRSPSGLCFSRDNQTLYATAANIGQVSLFAIDLATERVRILVREGVVQGVDVADDRLVYAHCHLKSPAELYSISAEGRDKKTVTAINARRLAEIDMGDYEQFSFKGWNDETVYGYVVKPVGFDPTQVYPVAFLIHGGPQGSFNNTFHYRWNPQAYAGAGYGAVMVDFHGSTGYGQAFTDAIQGDWGGKPLEDLQKGLAAALKQYPWLDGSRVGALGGSFGGYMVNWIAGQWPDRFRCLVNHDGNLDERMAYFDTEELWFPEWDHQGTPWGNPEAYEKHNPVRFVGQWKTPMLVIHGGLDYRVVETQGLGTFNALQRRGIPSQLLYFPDENHWVLKPHNSIQWYDTVLAWLDRWVKPVQP